VPQRFLRPGIRNSERWNSVSFKAQSLYLRILTLVDDFGRYDGRPAVIHGDCWSIWNHKHPDEMIDPQENRSILQQLAEEGVNLIELYTSEGKEVLQVTQWQERIRQGVKERWPKNPKVAANCSKLQPSPPPSSSPPSPTPSGGACVVGEKALNGTHLTQFDAFWKLYPRKASIFEAQRAWSEVGASDHADRIMMAVESQIGCREWKKENGRFIPTPANWLRDGRWNDLPTSSKSIASKNLDSLARSAENL
jgi:hypothetical protein